MSLGVAVTSSDEQIYVSHTGIYASYVLGQLVTPVKTVLPSRQHVHATSAQSMNISIPDTEHKVDGMVPDSRLLRKYNPVSCSRFPSVDGIVPDN